MPVLSSTPPPDIDINQELIRRLVGDQLPGLAGQTIRIMESGWDNVMVRIGGNLALRLPRRHVADQLIKTEQKWLPWLAPQLPLEIPVPLHAGNPTAYYPYHWSLQTWIDGNTSDIKPAESHQSKVLAGFLEALHDLPVPEDAPANPVRDCPLSDKAGDIEARMAELASRTDAITPEVRTAWNAAIGSPQPDRACFIAGDMHARNILTRQGDIVAIIDWGDMCVGDPAVDFMSVWALFEDPAARKDVCEKYGATPEFLIRARGWAIFSGTILLHTGLQDQPRHAKMGEAVLRRITEDG